MSAQQHPYTAEAKEDDGLIAIDRIEETVKAIMHHNGYRAERAAKEMSQFAHGHADLYIQSKASHAVLNKIKAMVEALLSETCLNREEINDLILMVNT